MAASLTEAGLFAPNKALKRALAPAAKKTPNNVVTFMPAPKPGSSTTSLLEQEKELRIQLEKRAAKQFTMSVAALLNPKIGGGLFVVPKTPKPAPGKNNIPDLRFTPNSK